MSIGSAAYRYSAQEQTAPQPGLQVLENTRKKASPALLSPKSLGMVFLAVAVICLIVYNQACLTEVSSDINTMSIKISELESDNTRLLSAMESTVSLRVIEDTAKNELGMQRADKYQTEYVQIYQHDRVELSGEAPKDDLLTQAKLSIGSFVTTLKEYIGAR